MIIKLDEKRVQVIMAEQQLTNVQLASACGVSRQNISTILRRGTCALPTVGKLAKGLGVPVAEIIKEE